MKPGFVVAVSLLCLLVAGPCSAKHRRVRLQQVVKQEQPAQLAPALSPPTAPMPPPNPPQVSFQGGQLTISAQNSTLGDILKAVRVQTGATIDLPGNAPERVAGHFGPAPARDVLSSLLNGSHFNYLLLGSPTDPSALDRVILMAKSGSAVESSPPPNEQAATAYNQNLYARPMPAPMAPPGGNTVVVEGQDAQDDTTADDSTDATDDTADDQTDQTDQTDDQQTGDDQQSQQPPDGQATVKTPEQLLQELQQRQQQMQQQGIQPGMQPGMQPGFPNPGVPGQPGAGTQPHN